LVAVLGIGLSLTLAIFADRIIKGALGYKTMLIVPYAVAPAVAGVLWIFMFSPSLGVVSFALGKLGFDWNHYLNGTHAMTLIVLAAVWKQISYNFLFFLAGLQSIPKSLIEAAAIDGAKPWRRFWSIQFPLLSPTTFFLLVINIVYAFFDTFAIVDATTHGGPGQETSILVYKVYYDGFKAMDMGGSAAQSVTTGTGNDINMILDIPVQLTVELGRTRIPIKNILQLAQGSVVELDAMAGEPMDVLVNGFLIAQGEVVVVNDKFGIRLTDIVTPSERMRRLSRGN